MCGMGPPFPNAQPASEPCERTRVYHISHLVEQEEEGKFVLLLLTPMCLSAVR